MVVGDVVLISLLGKGRTAVGEERKEEKKGSL